ncbi:MAG TPA: hypothetical protein VFK85_10955 [Anaeromyxobacteraceae bacterium]|nr:hypothetical protein [Anaeromyxobacteraceae bacterium]
MALLRGVAGSCAVAALALTATAASASPQASAKPAKPVAVAAGRYVLTGTARANLGAWPRRDYEVDVLALVAPGDRPGDLRLHLWSRGYACQLRGRVDAQTVWLEPGQTCHVEFGDASERGRVDATLRSGSGRLRTGDLELRLHWDVRGSATVPGGGSVTVPGTTLEVPLPDAPAVPVRGTVEAEARGPRERT